SVFVDDAREQTTCIAFVRLQPEIGGELISRVLLASKDRHMIIIKYGVPNLVEENIDQGTNHSVHARYAGTGRLFRHILQDVVEILITYRNGVIRVPRIDLAVAPFEFQKQDARQAQRTQVFLETLQHFSLAHELINALVRRVLGRHIFYLDPVRLQRRGFSCHHGGERRHDRKRQQKSEKFTHRRSHSRVSSATEPTKV